MDYFHLLEVFASEVFTSHSMVRHERTAHYLSALAALSQALARKEQALAAGERIVGMLDRTADDGLKVFLEMQRQQAERDQEIAELELRGIDLWLNTMAGGFMGKDQLSDAVRLLADDVGGAAFDHVFSSDEELDAIITGFGAIRPP